MIRKDGTFISSDVFVMIRTTLGCKMDDIDGGLQKMPNKKLTYISLFSGAGVGCYGFKKEGYECIATCELLESRLEVQKANKKCKYSSGYIAGDLTIDEIKNRLFTEVEMWRKDESLETVDVIVATPPCQGMSTANYKKGDESKRNSLVVEAISIIKEISPKVFVLENVKAFLKTECTDLDGSIIPISESIKKNLGDYYHIYARVINFKDYGVPSSRPRTIVIGTRKDYIHFSPLNIFPLQEKVITVRQAIGDLKSLKYGEMSDDIYHSFREYPQYMEEWISHIAEGESAFNNADEYKPYKVVDGKKVILKGAHLGNKFRRLFWDKPGACIATRNDQLASQDTIHPSDNRVLSIRELMRLMTIPDDFKWTICDVGNLTSAESKKAFLKDYELNIRRCIGEAVPTHIMQVIAHNAKEMINFQIYAEQYSSGKNLTNCSSSFYTEAFNYEMNLKNTKETGAFYTPQTVVYEALSTVDLSKKKIVKILEPSVGTGAFLPQLLRLCDVCEKVTIDLCDVDCEAINKLKKLVSKLKYNRQKIKLRYITDNFLTTTQLENKYDLIVSNPPFAKGKAVDLPVYRKIYDVGKSNNLFAFFLDKYKLLSDEIVAILPKSFIMAPEYNTIRRKFETFGVRRIVDFGVKYFKAVFVEILSIHFDKNYTGNLIVENKLEHLKIAQPHNYIFHKKCWLLYRDSWFDEYLNTMQLDVFDFFRDRQITNSKLLNSGEIWVLRAKNILEDGTVVHKAGYDKFIRREDLHKFSVSQYLNSRAIIMPSFTYITRATRLPDGCLVNGSVAVLIPKINKDADINLDLYATDDFKRYYEIVKNKAKFTLNIDSNSVYYIGVKRNDQ